MTHLLAFAAGIAIGWYLGLNAVYHAEPTPWTRDDDEPIAPADPRATFTTTPTDLSTMTVTTADGTWEITGKARRYDA